MSVYVVICGACGEWNSFNYPSKGEGQLEGCWFCDEGKPLPSIRRGGIAKELALIENSWISEAPDD